MAPTAVSFAVAISRGVVRIRRFAIPSPAHLAPVRPHWRWRRDTPENVRRRPADVSARGLAPPLPRQWLCCLRTPARAAAPWGQPHIRVPPNELQQLDRLGVARENRRIRKHLESMVAGGLQAIAQVSGKPQGQECLCTRARNHARDSASTAPRYRPAAALTSRQTFAMDSTSCSWLPPYRSVRLDSRGSQ